MGRLLPFLQLYRTYRTTQRSASAAARGARRCMLLLGGRSPLGATPRLLTFLLLRLGEQIKDPFSRLQSRKTRVPRALH